MSRGNFIGAARAACSRWNKKPSGYVQGRTDGTSMTWRANVAIYCSSENIAQLRCAVGAKASRKMHRQPNNAMTHSSRLCSNRKLKTELHAQTWAQKNDGNLLQPALSAELFWLTVDKAQLGHHLLPQQVIKAPRQLPAQAPADLLFRPADLQDMKCRSNLRLQNPPDCVTHDSCGLLPLFLTSQRCPA